MRNIYVSEDFSCTNVSTLNSDSTAPHLQKKHLKSEILIQNKNLNIFISILRGNQAIEITVQPSHDKWCTALHSGSQVGIFPFNYCGWAFPPAAPPVDRLEGYCSCLLLIYRFLIIYNFFLHIYATITIIKLRLSSFHQNWDLVCSSCSTFYLIVADLGFHLVFTIILLNQTQITIDNHSVLRSPKITIARSFV